MCKTKKKMMREVIDPKNYSNSQFSTPRNPSATTNSATTTSSSYKDSSSRSSVSRRTSLSLSSLRDSLPSDHIYDFSEICSATNNFSTKQRHSSSSSSVSSRCNLRGDDVIVFQRKLRRPTNLSELREKLSLICKSHYTSLIKLKGASISGNYVYLVYDFVQGANLATCLRSPRNPSFTVLSNWMSRIQIATDIAHGLDYIHNSAGLKLSFVHNHIKSTSIIITEPSLNARICHFGTAELCGEIVKDEETKRSKNYKRSDSQFLKVDGTRGYMSPEYQSTGLVDQRSDVYAFGIVILELLSGEEPLKYRFDDEGGGYVRVSVIETARVAVEGGGLRRWVDKRLKDSYPVVVAERLTRVGLECVEEDPEKRPGMALVAGRVSKLYLESQTWAEKMGVPTDFTVSLAPR